MKRSLTQSRIRNVLVLAWIFCAWSIFAQTAQPAPTGQQAGQPGAGAVTPAQPGAGQQNPAVAPAGEQTTAAGTPATGQGNQEGVRLKDMARILGIRSNQLLGYGIVVGLPGTGDSRSRLASESIRNLLGALGQKLEASSGNARNIAAVLVTAEAPPFARRGDRMDVTVSSIGDARSLEGGVLIQTPLYAGNNDIYAVAQGPLTSGGRTQQRSGQGKTVALVMSGAHVEKEIQSTFLENRRLRISLLNFDFATLNEILGKIKAANPEVNAVVEGGSISLDVPPGKDPVAFIAALEEIRIVPHYNARVVINERTGTIVMGGDVKIDPVSVSRGGLQIIVTGKQQAQNAGARQEERHADSFELTGSSVSELIEALNQIGASVRDIIAILEALKESGALHAELVVI